MRIKLILTVSFLVSSLYAQTGFVSLNRLKAELNITDKNHYRDFNTVWADKTNLQRHSPLNLCGQFLVGQTLAAGATYITVIYFFNPEDSHDGPQSVFILVPIFSSYIIGAAVGVYWIAQYENPELSFWGTTAYSFIGAAGGVLIFIAAKNILTHNDSNSGILSILALLCPVFSSVLYTSLIASWVPEDNSNINYQMSDPPKMYSHKDLIEKTMLVKFNLLYIAL